MTATRLLTLLAGLALLVVAPASARPFPDVIPLPTGFQPEGIAVGKGHTFYVGSIPTGAVYRGDLRTGAGSVLVGPQAGRSAIGLEVDDRSRIFVAGGMTGQAYVYDGRTGAALAAYQLAPAAPTFVNDVAVTKDAAWFTDSNRALLYRVPISRNGTLGGQADVQIVPLTGDFALAPGFNANGIDATPDGRTLVIVQSNLGRLYTVDAGTGEADLVALSGGDVSFGDGILLDGKTLYAVQNQLNRVAVVALAPDLGAGTITGHLTDPALDVPTTIAAFGSRLYAVNARFGTPNPATAAYSVLRPEK
ncbi:MAG: SMP-30/gluconolactonase/LRE family protein [Gaiellaceae bacterium]